MIYAVVFGIFCLYLILMGIWLQGAGWFLLWPGISFGIVAAGYAGAGPGVFGKRKDGRLALWALVLLFPYLLLTWLLWHLTRFCTSGDHCNEVAPGIWIGRRPFVHELPQGVILIVDLTCELAESQAVIQHGRYICLPTLDTCPPEEAKLRQLLQEMKSWQGGIYIHCALGHGRSALVTASLLLARRVAHEAREAIRCVRQVRPGARLKPRQRQLLERFAVEFSSTNEEITHA